MIKGVRENKDVAKETGRRERERNLRRIERVPKPDRRNSKRTAREDRGSGGR